MLNGEVVESTRVASLVTNNEEAGFGDLCDNRRGVRNDTLSTRQSDGTPCDFLCLSDTDGI